MESKSDRQKLKDLLDYTKNNFLNLRRTWLSHSFEALIMSNDTFVVKAAEKFAPFVLKGNEMYIKLDAEKFLDAPEMKTHYDTKLATQLKEFPRDRLAQARSYKSRLTKKGFEVTEDLSPDKQTIWLRWKEKIDEPVTKNFKNTDIDLAFRFAELKKKEGFEVEQEMVNGEIVVKWKDIEKKASKDTTTSTDEADTKKNSKD